MTSSTPTTNLTAFTAGGAAPQVDCHSAAPATPPGLNLQPRSLAAADAVVQDDEAMAEDEVIIVNEREVSPLAADGEDRKRAHGRGHKHHHHNRHFGKRNRGFHGHPAYPQAFFEESEMLHFPPPPFAFHGGGIHHHPHHGYQHPPNFCGPRQSGHRGSHGLGHPHPFFFSFGFGGGQPYPPPSPSPPFMHERGMCGPPPPPPLPSFAPCAGGAPPAPPLPHPPSFGAVGHSLAFSGPGVPYFGGQHGWHGHGMKGFFGGGRGHGPHAFSFDINEDGEHKHFRRGDNHGQFKRNASPSSWDSTDSNPCSEDSEFTSDEEAHDRRAHAHCGGPRSGEHPDSTREDGECSSSSVVSDADLADKHGAARGRRKHKYGKHRAHHWSGRMHAFDFDSSGGMPDRHARGHPHAPPFVGNDGPDRLGFRHCGVGGGRGGRTFGGCGGRPGFGGHGGGRGGRSAPHNLDGGGHPGRHH